MMAHFKVLRSRRKKYERLENQETTFSLDRKTFILKIYLNSNIVAEKLDQFRFPGNCPGPCFMVGGRATYPSFKLTLTLTSYLGQNVSLAEG